MEYETKSGMDGTQLSAGSRTKEVRRVPMQQLAGYVLRLAALVMTLVGAIVMGVAKETQTVSVQIAPTLPPVAITATAKASYSSAFVYVLVANAIACAYSAISLAISITSKGSKRNLALIISIVDVLVMALLFSSNGAAAAIGVVGKNGNSHVRWNKICDVYGNFCKNVIAAVVLSLLGSLAYLLLVVFTVVDLHRRSP